MSTRSRQEHVDDLLATAELDYQFKMHLPLFFEMGDYGDDPDSADYEFRRQMRQNYGNVQAQLNILSSHLLGEVATPQLVELAA